MVSSFLFRHFTERRDRTFRITFVTSFTGLLILAWANRFVQDDAFISFRYAHNLAYGQGLVWNPGERLEGYTNFLWTLLMSVPIYFGFDPVAFSFAVGLILYFFSLLLTFKLAVLLFDSRRIALLTVILMGTNYTFSAYATGGLETQLQTSLITAAVLLTLGGMAENNWSARRLQRLSLVSALAVLTRPDSPLLLSVLLAFTVLQLIRAPFGIKQRLIKLATLISPFSVLVVPGTDSPAVLHIVSLVDFCSSRKSIRDRCFMPGDCSWFSSPCAYLSRLGKYRQCEGALRPSQRNER